MKTASKKFELDKENTKKYIPQKLLIFVLRTQIHKIFTSLVVVIKISFLVFFLEIFVKISILNRKFSTILALM